MEVSERMGVSTKIMDGGWEKQTMMGSWKKELIMMNSWSSPNSVTGIRKIHATYHIQKSLTENKSGWSEKHQPVTL